MAPQRQVRAILAMAVVALVGSTAAQNRTLLTRPDTEDCGLDCLRASLQLATQEAGASLAPAMPSLASASGSVLPVVAVHSGEVVRPNATLLPGSVQRRMAQVSSLQNHKGTIIFTHLRRAGGTVLETYVLRPFCKHLEKETHSKAGETYNCREGGLARHYRMDQSTLARISTELEHVSLVWRHCPFGVHEIIHQPFVYITMLRTPIKRLLSWAAYCIAYSPNNCMTLKFKQNSGSRRRRPKPGVDQARRFYEARSELNAKTKLPSFRGLEPFHPPALEFRLDDNYSTRMLCGEPAHDHPVPIGREHLACALRNMDQQYAFVGVTERYEASICVLRELLRIPKKYVKDMRNDKATTGSTKRPLPPEMAQVYAPYVALDNELHAYAHMRLDQDLAQSDSCSEAFGSHDHDIGELERFRKILSL